MLLRLVVAAGGTLALLRSAPARLDKVLEWGLSELPDLGFLTLLES